MYLFRTYECPECGGRFELMQERDEGPPRFCVKCGADFGEDAEPVPAKIAVGGSAIGRATDGMYRELEQSSAARAEELGDKSLKITDLKDNLREGDVAAKVPDNTVTRFVREATGQVGVNYMGWGGGFTGGRVGPVIGTPGQAYAGPGHIALAAAQPEHERRVQEVVSHPSAKPYVGGR